MNISIDPEIWEWISNPDHLVLLIVVAWYLIAWVVVRIFVIDRKDGEIVINRLMIWALSPAILALMILSEATLSRSAWPFLLTS